MKLRFFLAHLLLSIAACAQIPQPAEHDFAVQNFRFKSGESLPTLKLHYYTFGTLQNDSAGHAKNAVLILHGTGGSGSNFLTPTYAGVLFKPGGLLDAAKYFIVIPDNLGHGASTKPSDGLHARFPHYEYDDMIELQYRLLTEGLGVDHLRLVMGTSMGGMHTWLWAEQHPDFMDAAMPLASQPVAIAGRNRMWRRMVMDDIRNSPDYNNGDYTRQPIGLTAAQQLEFIMGSAPLYLQTHYPTRDAADTFMEEAMASRLQTLDANDKLYAFDSSRNYNPEPALEKITAPLTSVNSADDQINPPELQITEHLISRVKNGKFVLLPITPETRGHGTHSLPAIWSQHLAELLQRSEH